MENLNKPVYQNGEIVGTVTIESKLSIYANINGKTHRFYKQLKNGFLVTKKQLPLFDEITNYTI